MRSGISLIRPPFPRTGELPQPTNLLPDGRLFFDSFDRLSPADTNGGVEDVYEYEADNVGTCHSAAENGGCLSLVSSGADAAPSGFLDATPSGRDVFFTTRAQLVPRDTDGLVDLYDARENGGIAESEVPPCSGDGCQGASQAPPFKPASGSSSATGPGNEPPKAPGKHKKPHHKKRHHKRAHRRHANTNRRARR